MVVEKPIDASLRGKIIGRMDYGRKCWKGDYISSMERPEVKEVSKFLMNIMGLWREGST